MSATDISSHEFKKEVLDSNIPVLVDFWAPWCTPCKMMAPVLDQLSQDPGIKGKIKILKVNTDKQENQMLALALNIQSIPNMKLFINGKIKKDFIGMRPLEVFRNELITTITSI